MGEGNSEGGRKREEKQMDAKWTVRPVRPSRCCRQIIVPTLSELFQAMCLFASFDVRSFPSRSQRRGIDAVSSGCSSSNDLSQEQTLASLLSAL